MMKKKWIEKLYILLFVAAFMLPAPAYYVMKGWLDTHNYENRSLPEAPAFTAENYSTYPRQVEQWLSGIMPFKNQLATVGGLADYYVFHETMKSDLVIGKEGWMFYTGQQTCEEDPIADWLGTDLFTVEELQTLAERFCTARDVMEARGGEFVLVISPSKAKIYPELMPERFGKPAEYTRLQQVVEYLRFHTDLNIVTPEDDILAWKEKYPEQRLFLKYDTHESYVASYISADAILDVLRQEPLPDQTQLVWQFNENGKADLANMLGLKGIVKDEYNAWNVAWHRHYINEWSDEDETEMRFVNENGDGDPRRLMMISDSFGALMFPYLADYFNYSYLIYPYRYEPSMLEAEDPDILVYEVTERFLRVPLTFSLTE